VLKADRSPERFRREQFAAPDFPLHQLPDGVHFLTIRNKEEPPGKLVLAAAFATVSSRNITGEEGAYRIFNGLRAPKFPVACPRGWCIYSAGRPIPTGKHPLPLTYLHATNQSVCGHDSEFETAERSQVTNCLVIGRGLFPPGRNLPCGFHATRLRGARERE
jgi:hypothetical protein